MSASAERDGTQPLLRAYQMGRYPLANRIVIADTLGAAWAAFLKNSPPDDKDAFAKGWSAARKTALTGAGMDPVFE